MRTNELFERITRQIIVAVEAGAEAYQMPWQRWAEGTAQPINAASGRSYRGINTLLLWAAAEAAGYSSGRWSTYKQWAQAGGQVRKGEKSTAILFWKSAANDQPDMDETDKDGPGRPRFVARVYAVFNAEQVDGAEPAATRPILSPEARIEPAENFVAATAAQIRHGGDRACYVANIDQIWLPQFEQFRDAESYYSTVGHELVHWSGAKHRLSRDLSGRFGSDGYAMEELVAELGAAFIAAHLGFAVEARQDHAAYISSWLRVLRGDPRAILTASAKAQEAFDYLIGCSSAEAVREVAPVVAEHLEIGDARRLESH